jgi:hypothetical protein
VEPPHNICTTSIYGRVRQCPILPNGRRC